GPLTHAGRFEREPELRVAQAELRLGAFAGGDVRGDREQARDDALALDRDDARVPPARRDAQEFGALRRLLLDRLLDRGEIVRLVRARDQIDDQRAVELARIGARQGAAQVDDARVEIEYRNDIRRMRENAGEPFRPVSIQTSGARGSRHADL